MSVALIAVDPDSPAPPFDIDTVFIAKGLTELPKNSADHRRLIICLAGSAEITVHAGEVQVFELTTPALGLLVESGVSILSVGGATNVATVIFAGTRETQQPPR